MLFPINSGNKSTNRQISGGDTKTNTKPTNKSAFSTLKFNIIIVILAIR